MPSKKEVSNLLNTIADMMDFKDENRFKVNAFRNGANVIRRIDGDIEEVVKNRSLDGIKGIGKGLQSVIYEYFEKGESTLYNELKSEVPDGIEELLKVRGLGAKKIKILNSELGISSIGELEYACNENRLALLKGFGEATQNKILKEIDKLKYYSKFVLLNQGYEFAVEIEEKFKNISSIKKIERSGELRRGMEIISSIIFVILINDKNKLLNELKKSFDFEEDDNKLLIKEYFNIPVTLVLTKDEIEFQKQLFLTTGSDNFLTKLGVAVDDINGETEEEIFKNFNSQFIIPEMREKEYFEAKKKKLKENSNLKPEHFNGLLHFHTTFSDGRNTLNEMITGAQQKGFKFAAVCDHSKAAFYANGLDEDRILLQNKEIKKLTSNEFPVFQGIESDILQDGSLDYSNDFMQNFDFVVASIHSRFQMKKEEMTARIIKAVENPHTDLLAHPSGRLLLSRDPYEFDTKKVIDACSQNNVVIEINANPRRLDLDWRWVYYAREKDCQISINPDAHSVAEIDYTNYGVIIGRKAGLQKEEVINCFSFNDFKKFLMRKVNRKF